MFSEAPGVHNECHSVSCGRLLLLCNCRGWDCWLSAGYYLIGESQSAVVGARWSALQNVLTQEGFLSTLLQIDSFDSPAQAFTSEDGVPNTRGRILGGSSAINAGFYSRADQDFSSKSGLSWDLRLVNESYEWVEKTIVFRPELRSWQSSIRDSLLEAGISPYNTMGSVWSQEQK